MISTQSLGQASMDATRFLHLHSEEFSCVIVSQALLQSKPEWLHPKLRPTLQALPHIPNPRLLAPMERKPPLGSTVYPTIHQKGFLCPLVQHNHSITTTQMLAERSLCHSFYRDPHSSSGATRACTLLIGDPPHLASNPFENLAQPKHEDP